MMRNVDEVEAFIREGRESNAATREKFIDKLAQGRPLRKQAIRPAVSKAIEDGRIVELPRGFKGVPSPRRRDPLVSDPMDR